MSFQKAGVRPLAKFTNQPKTHSVSLHKDKMQVNTQYAYQSLRNDVDYKNVASVKVSASDVRDPLSRTVTITTKNRQLYEIPSMSTNDALKLKNNVDMYHGRASQRRSEVNKAAKSRVSTSMPAFRR